MSRSALPPPLHGQGPRPLRGRPRPHAHRRVRPRLGVRRRAARRRSPTRAGCSPRSRRSGSSRPPTSAPNHVMSSDPTDFPETAGPEIARAGDARARDPTRCGSSASPAATSSARRGPSTRSAGTVQGRPLPAGLRQAERLPEPLFTPPPRPTPATTSRSPTPRPPTLVGDDIFEQLRDRDARDLRVRRRARGDAGRDPRRHQVRVRRPSTASCSSSTRCSRPTRRATGRPSDYDVGGVAAVVRQAVRARPLPRRSAGTSSPPAPPLPAARDRGHAGALRRGLRAAHRRELRRLVRPGETERPDRRTAPVRSTRMRFAAQVDVTHLPGRARPAGRDGRAGAPGARLHERVRGAIGKSIRLVVDADDEAAARAQVDEMCHRLLANPVIEALHDRRSQALADADERTRSASSCSRAPTASSTCVHAVEHLGGTAELLWHGDRTVARRRRGRRARRLRPRRLPPHRRHRPVLAGDGRGRRASPPPAVRSSASATASRCSPRPACSRARCRRTPAQVPLRHRGAAGSRPSRRCSPTASRPAPSLRIPINHFEGNYVCDAETLERLRADDRIVLRYVDNPNGSLDDIAGISNEAGNVVGLMPHPERASEMILGSRRRRRCCSARCSLTRRASARSSGSTCRHA